MSLQPLRSLHASRPADRAVLCSRLAEALPPGAFLAGDAVDARYRGAGDAGAEPRFVMRPTSSAEVARCLAACDAAGQPVVVQGGRTGLSGGERVLEGEAVLSLERMASLSAVDRASSSVIAEAGVPLQRVQEAAEAAGLYFGVDLGARGTATVGGNVATNAGGMRVLRYGMYRAQVLGLEAVLADGTVLSSLKGLAKDNAGYDLGQLFIGSEGTLGVVTRAALRLHPKPAGECAAFCALGSVEAAGALLSRLRAALGTALSAFEIILPEIYESVLAHSDAPRPVAARGAVYVLAESHGLDPQREGERFAQELMAACEAGIVEDVALSQSPRDVHRLWALREGCSHHIASLPDCVGCDISLPLATMGAFLTAASAAVRGLDAGARPLVFGHLGDGNLHYIVQTGAPEAVVEAVLRLVREAGGSVSAEHGIGLDKKRWLALSRDRAEIATMRRLKAALDPNAILNRGRIFDPEPEAASGSAGS
ncbi:FAD-binding oxidoreductase [Aureimonas populi]|uniref:FAD-binding oxidoreductase n=1 Tax=Aureimonas populi TaxID=1701758 RepID=A0ABW5CHM1_9HYPH|nr:FAD-binding oxidoreductase [Aureimonas populi]